MSVIVDSVTILWPETLPTPLMERALSNNPRNWETVMESKRTRARPSADGTLEIMSVSWKFTADQYAAFKTFFEDVLIQGTEVFVMATLEPDDDPQLVRDTLYQLAFYTSNYTWHQEDDFMAVQADLLLGAQSYTAIDNPFNPRPPVHHYRNVEVFYFGVCDVEDTLSYIGVLPSWITIDIVGNSFTGKANTYDSTVSQDDANTQAQTALDDFVTSHITSGAIVCTPPVPEDPIILVFNSDNTQITNGQTINVHN